MHIGFEQVKPPWLMAVGAVALLACGKPVSGSRTFGRTSLHVPKTHQDTTAQVRPFPPKIEEKKPPKKYLAISGKRPWGWGGGGERVYG